ncbi:MAG: LysE family translocator [Chloroflexota bacterium]|nr:LysE family translocator [Chloroflexota bacterium]
MSIEFLITSLILVITPGPGVIYTLTAGISRGQRASVVAAIGCTVGIVPHLAAAIFGVAALLYASAMAFQALKLLGVIYLLYMAWVTIRDQSGFTVDADNTGRSDREVIQSAILVNALNPKLAIFFFAFLPQFVHADDPRFLTRMLGLSGVFMALTLGVFVIYGLLAAALRLQIASRPRVVAWLRRSFAAAFVALGLRLAVAER